MRLHSIAMRESPRAPGWRRLEAWVEYDAERASPEEYWLEVPSPQASALVGTGDPWVAWLAPLAITLGEPLRIDAPVDARLLAGVREAVRIWTTWYPRLRASRVEALDGPVERFEDRGEHAASFFSGGVDSFFTALRHQRNVTGLPIDSLIFVWGFDIPLSNVAAWNTALSANATVARQLGLPVLPVVTNLRETRFARTDWTRLSHGPALAGIAQALGGAFGAVYLPSSASYRDLRPWGSHPETDVLFTSDRVRIIHDGAEWRRSEKTEYIAQSELALRHLRVCYQSSNGTNCSTCKRCYRTMLALEVVGALDRCATFDRGALDLRKAARVYCDSEPDIKQFGFVRELALRKGRNEIVRAIDSSLRRSTRMVRVVRFLRRLRDVPLLWRWAPAWERRLLRRWVV